VSPNDAGTVAAQLGRQPRGRWRVAVRCPAGAPAVIAVAPLLEDGTPFPTYLWLTCPVLVELVGVRESAGAGAAWAARAAADPALAAGLVRASDAYRAMRAEEAGGDDPCEGGVAGERDPLRVKCLHARVAAALAGIEDPVGASYLVDVAAAMTACDGRTCVSANGEDAVDSVSGDQGMGGTES
jgi:hypothetical protein